MELASQPNELGWAVFAVFVSLASVATVTFTLRVYVQVRILKRASTWEDCFAGIGWVLFMVFAGLTISSAFYGLGKYSVPMPPPGLWIAVKVRAVSKAYHVMRLTFNQ